MFRYSAVYREPIVESFVKYVSCLDWQYVKCVASQQAAIFVSDARSCPWLCKSMHSHRVIFINCLVSPKWHSFPDLNSFKNFCLLFDSIRTKFSIWLSPTNFLHQTSSKHFLECSFCDALTHLNRFFLSWYSKRRAVFGVKQYSQSLSWQYR